MATLANNQSFVRIVLWWKWIVAEVRVESGAIWGNLQLGCFKGSDYSIVRLILQFANSFRLLKTKTKPRKPGNAPAKFESAVAARKRKRKLESKSAERQKPVTWSASTRWPSATRSEWQTFLVLCFCAARSWGPDLASCARLPAW